MGDCAASIATGDTTGGETGDFRIDGSGAGMTGEGALVRVANGDERLLSRTNKDSVAGIPSLTLGAATIRGRSMLLASSGSLDLDLAAEIDGDRKSTRLNSSH